MLYFSDKFYYIKGGSKKRKVKRMHKEDKNPHIEKEHAEHHHPHHPEAACDSGCKCGCQEGKECTCGCGKDCGCGKSCGCGCGKKCIFKVLALLIVFLAGMGFNEMLHCCCAPCPVKAPRVASMMRKAPSFVDESGNTIIIINTDGSHGAAFAGHHAKKFGGKKDKHFKFHGKDKTAENSIPQTDSAAE